MRNLVSFCNFGLSNKNSPLLIASWPCSSKGGAVEDASSEQQKIPPNFPSVPPRSALLHAAPLRLWCEQPSVCTLKTVSELMPLLTALLRSACSVNEP